MHAASLLMRRVPKREAEFGCCQDFGNRGIEQLAAGLRKTTPKAPNSYPVIRDAHQSRRCSLGAVLPKGF